MKIPRVIAAEDLFRQTLLLAGEYVEALRSEGSLDDPEYSEAMHATFYLMLSRFVQWKQCHDAFALFLRDVGRPLSGIIMGEGTDPTTQLMVAVCYLHSSAIAVEDVELGNPMAEAIVKQDFEFSAERLIMAWDVYLSTKTVRKVDAQ